MDYRGYRLIKDRFHVLIGSLSIREIMSNQALIEQIKTLSKLLTALSNH